MITEAPELRYEGQGDFHLRKECGVTAMSLAVASKRLRYLTQAATSGIYFNLRSTLIAVEYKTETGLGPTTADGLYLNGGCMPRKVIPARGVEHPVPSSHHMNRSRLVKS